MARNMSGLQVPKSIPQPEGPWSRDCNNRFSITCSLKASPGQKTVSGLRQITCNPFSKQTLWPGNTVPSLLASGAERRNWLVS